MERPWYKSKKLWATVIGVVGVVAHQIFDIPKETVSKAVEMIMAYVVGQGIADLGKNKLS